MVIWWPKQHAMGSRVGSAATHSSFGLLFVPATSSSEGQLAAGAERSGQNAVGRWGNGGVSGWEGGRMGNAGAASVCSG